MSKQLTHRIVSQDDVHCLALLSTCIILQIDCIAAHMKFCLLPFYIFIAFVQKIYYY